MAKIKNERIIAGKWAFYSTPPPPEAFRKAAHSNQGSHENDSGSPPALPGVHPENMGVGGKAGGIHAQLGIVSHARLIWYGGFSCIQISIEPSSANCLKGNANGCASKG